MLKTTFFNFKEFEIEQNDLVMKVGTDAMLLGAFCESGTYKNILDIGTGTGVLSLMLAQKTEGKITAIETNNNAYELAKRNICNSKFSERIEVLHTTFQDFLPPNSFDLIICNPPFFSDSKEISLSSRRMARINSHLPLSFLIEKASKILNTEGTFWCILPFQQKEDVLGLTGFHHLYPNRIINVSSYKESKPIRVIFSISKKILPFADEDFYIYESQNVYSDDYYRLTFPYHNRIPNQISY